MLKLFSVCDAEDIGMHFKAYVYSFFLVCSVISSSVEFEMPEGYVDPSDMFNFDYASKTNHKPGDPINDDVAKEKNIKEERDRVDDATVSKDSVPANKEQQQEKPLEKSKPDTKISDGWIDPSDMENFDPTPVLTKKPSKSVKDASTQVPKEDYQPNTCPHPFLHRFVGVIYRKLEYVGSPPNIKDYEMTVHLNDRNWLVLQDFADDCKASAPEVTRVLEEMVTDIHVEVKEQLMIRVRRKFEDILCISFEDALRILLCFFLLICILALEIVSHVSWIQQLKRLIVVGIFVSFVMTYIHELKLAEAKNRSNLSKEIPSECINGIQDLTYLGSLKTMYRDMFSVEKDPCAKYHEDHIIDPKLTVTPTKVFAVTLTRFIVEPMEHMGTAFSKAFKNIFRDIPVTLWIPAFVFVILIIIGFLMIVSVLFGYSFNFNLPFWTGLHMGPQNVQNPQLERIIDDNRHQIEQQRTIILELEERLRHREALPAPPTEDKTTNPRAILGRGSSRRHETPASTPNPPVQREGPTLPYPEFNDQFERQGGPADAQGHFYEPPRYEEPTLRRRNPYSADSFQRPSAQGQGDASYAFVPKRTPEQSTVRVVRTPAMPNPIGFEHLMQENATDDNMNRPKTGLHPEGEESEKSSTCSYTDVKLPITKSVNKTQVHASGTRLQNVADQSNVQNEPDTEKFSIVKKPENKELAPTTQTEVETIPTPEEAAAIGEETWEDVSREFEQQEANHQVENRTPADLRYELEQEALGGFSITSNQ